MSTTLTIVLIIVVLVIIAAIVFGVQAGRRKKLRSTFGPEYDRVVADTGSTSWRPRWNIMNTSGLKMIPSVVSLDLVVMFGTPIWTFVWR